jgi:hypothetical protein
MCNILLIKIWKRNLNVAGLDEFVGKLGCGRAHNSRVEKCDISNLNTNKNHMEVNRYL